MKDAAAEWAAEWHDEVLFAYASGDVGDNEDANFAEAFANNPIEAPDAFHIVYQGGQVSAAGITAAHKMDLELVQKVAVKARMLNAENPNVVSMRPVKLSQGEHFLMVMSEHQAYDLRIGSGASNWLEVQKAAGQRGDQNPIFTAKMGMIDDVVLAKHTGVRRFVDYGAGANVKAARSLFLGAQGLTVAYGSGNGTRMMWDERSADYNNKIAIAAGMIFGAKKTRYKPKGSATGYDFGVIAVDTAAAPSY
jgi:N4-gp56 family major capsid protein